MYDGVSGWLFCGSISQIQIVKVTLKTLKRCFKQEAKQVIPVILVPIKAKKIRVRPT